MLDGQAQSQVKLLEALFGNAPALPPPPGVTPNFVNPPSKENIIIASTVICLVVVIFFVAIRVFVKLRVNKLGFRLEEWFCVIGAAFFLAFSIIVLVALRFGTGRHQWDVTIHNAQQFSKLATVLEVAYCWAICFAKLSLAVTYLRIFANTRFTLVWYCCWSIILFNIGLYIALLLTTLLTCIPLEKLWNPLIPGYCVNAPALFITSGALNMGFDIATLVLPLVCVWRLQMSSKRKRGVSMVLATGVFCVACSLLRFINAVKYAANKDQTWFLIDQALWSEGEITSALMASCMLSIPQFLQVTFPRLAERFGSAGATINTSRHVRPGKPHSLPQNCPGHRDGPSSPLSVHTNPMSHQESYSLEKTKNSISENENETDASSPSEHEWA